MGGLNPLLIGHQYLAVNLILFIHHHLPFPANQDILGGQYGFEWREYINL